MKGVEERIVTARAGAQLPRLSKLIEDKDSLERVAVHAVPVGIGGEAEGAVGGLAAAAATEKIASVAGNLVAGDGDVLEDALLHRVVVGIKGGDGELGKYVILGVRQGVDLGGRRIIKKKTDFSLLRVDATVASRGTESRRTASVVELELCHCGWDFLVGQHQAEHGDCAGQCEVVGLHF